MLSPFRPALHLAATPARFRFPRALPLEALLVRSIWLLVPVLLVRVAPSLSRLAAQLLLLALAVVSNSARVLAGLPVALSCSVARAPAPLVATFFWRLALLSEQARAAVPCTLLAVTAAVLMVVQSRWLVVAVRLRVARLRCAVARVLVPVARFLLPRVTVLLPAVLFPLRLVLPRLARAARCRSALVRLRLALAVMFPLRLVPVLLAKVAP